jgi:hypothetical protein
MVIAIVASGSGPRTGRGLGGTEICHLLSDSLSGQSGRSNVQDRGPSHLGWLGNRQAHVP